MQPTPYTPKTDFSEQEAKNASGRAAINTAALDAEFDAVKKTTDDVRNNLALIQRDDGALRNLSVHPDALSGAVRLLLASGAFAIDPGGAAWLAGRDYLPGRIVEEGGIGYLCVLPHTSGTFAADLAAGKWIRVAPVVFDVAAVGVDFIPAAGISAGNVQAAIEELSASLRPSTSLYLASTYGAL